MASGGAGGASQEGPGGSDSLMPQRWPQAGWSLVSLPGAVSPQHCPLHLRSEGSQGDPDKLISACLLHPRINPAFGWSTCHLSVVRAMTVTPMPQAAGPASVPSSRVTLVSLSGPCTRPILGTTQNCSALSPRGLPPHWLALPGPLLQPPPQSSWEVTMKAFPL